MAAFMQKPSNLRAARAISSYKFAQSNQKVVTSGLNTLLLNPESTYQFPWRPLKYLLNSTDKFAKFKHVCAEGRANRTLSGI